MKFPLKRFNDFCSELLIDSKEYGQITLEKQLGTQRYAIEEIVRGLEEDVHFFDILKARQLGVCLDPDTLVLTADLRWVRIADVPIGQEVVSVDESPLGGRGSARHMRTGTVTGVVQVHRKAYRITFDDGRHVICTGQHPWLSRKENSETAWRCIEGWYRSGLKVGTRVRWITKPWRDATYEDGWFGGMLDGEGSFSLKKEAGASVNASQLLGPVFDRMIEYCETRGYHYRIDNDKSERNSKFGKRPVPKIEIARMDEVFRVIGQTRPSRFIGKRFWEGKELPGKKSGIGWAKIVSIEPLGEQTMIDLQTTMGTYIAEGFVSHNTTITLALDLFWHYEYPGMQGTLAADNEENRDMFRSTLTMFHEGLPRSHRIRCVQNNRNFMAFANRSRMLMQIGGASKKKGAKGRGKGLTYLHATETASWDDEESLASIMASLAELNPTRLAIFESTGRGFNMRYRMWRSAKQAVTKKSIFIGWWRNELYRKEKESPEFTTYWDGKLTGEETEWVRAIKQFYDYDISEEQMAWWRWKLEEEIHDPMLMVQEYPHTEEHAFILTGKNFFRMTTLEKIKTAIDAEGDPVFYAFNYGRTDDGQEDFMRMSMVEVTANDAELKVWEEPDVNGYYSIGADPAYGSSDWADRFAISVLRCYSDRVEQVAEFCTDDMNFYRFAWMLCFLAGAYRNCRVNLEVNGPGQGVLAEMNNLRRKAAAIYSNRKPDETALQDVLGNIKYFVYSRPDAIRSDGVYHWKTTQETKDRMMVAYKDSMDKGELVLHSEELVEEMKIIVREDDGFLGASGRQKDDRVIATALAIVQYVTWMKTPLLQQKITWKSECDRRAEREKTGKDGMKDDTVSRAVRKHFGSMGWKGLQ